LKFIFN